MNARRNHAGKSGSPEPSGPGESAGPRAIISPSLVARGFRVSLAVFSHAWVKCAVWIVGFVVQMVLVVLMWELVDICTQVAEMWVALARKHLELTM